MNVYNLMYAPHVALEPDDEGEEDAEEREAIEQALEEEQVLGELLRNLQKQDETTGESSRPLNNGKDLQPCTVYHKFLRKSTPVSNPAP